MLLRQAVPFLLAIPAHPMDTGRCFRSSMRKKSTCTIAMDEDMWTCLYPSGCLSIRMKSWCFAIRTWVEFMGRCLSLPPYGSPAKRVSGHKPVSRGQHSPPQENFLSPFECVLAWKDFFSGKTLFSAVCNCVPWRVPIPRKCVLW